MVLPVLCGADRKNVFDMTHNVKSHFDRLSSQYSHNYTGRKDGKGFEFGKRPVGQVVVLDCLALSSIARVERERYRPGAYRPGRSLVPSSWISRAPCSLVRWLGNKHVCANVEFRQSDIFDYPPAANQKFEVILCLGLIAHTGELSELLTHLKAMLSENGRILLQTSVADHMGVRIVRRLVGGRSTSRAGY